ncbi:hypothetical protein J4Q44_G00227830 [Coregonus suidteri]|uniref:Uncharacterized protein n=1 Tax=Coregonus suidteri TaxID=861788 RepID=A0AAN8LCK9_9TELE
MKACHPAKAAAQSSTTCTISSPTTDWCFGLIKQRFRKTRVNTLPLLQIKQYQHFSFNALEPGVVVTKDRLDSVGSRFQLLRDAHVLPPIDVQAAPGLDTTKQTYLFEKMWEFCDKEAMDITCPASKSRAGQKQAL